MSSPRTTHVIGGLLVLLIVLFLVTPAVDSVRVKSKPVIPFTTRLGSTEEWEAVVHPPETTFSADHRRLVLVAYTVSWCGTKCVELRRAYTDVAAHFARMKLFSEVVIADCVGDEVDIGRLAEDGIRQFPMVVIYGTHLNGQPKVFLGDTSDREAIIDFTKDHLLRLHDFRRDL